ncbi:hypothetical protein K8T06_15450 [bacterium]|nr:hypothetical protein [bacterium]
MRIRQKILILTINTALLLWFCACGNKYPCSTSEKFNESSWSQADPMKRQCMVEDLITNYKLEGKTQAEILTFLGEPDKKRTVNWEYTRPRRKSSMKSLKKRYGEDAPDRLSSIYYDLGSTDDGLFGMSWKLYIRFYNGIVEKYDVVGDD